ncbi:hypothetical protein CR969_00255 [Candidatus Saccharibacteria bacterium]|nr:MAG: hypothetical protein CR969_00255 [Candidatus Saccharibacteria bacterium]
MSESTKTDISTTLVDSVKKILADINQEREREIISRRFGLYDRKETLEQIGDMLGITRERVRQLEKAILSRVRQNVSEGNMPVVNAMEKTLTAKLSEMGRAARIQDLASELLGQAPSPTEKAHIAFLAELAPNITVIGENDDYFQSAAISSLGDASSIKKKIEEIVKFIKKHGEPITADAMHEQMKYEHPSNIAALASLSKKLAQLKGNWGLIKWPTVNPKNIRDKIFVILEDNGKPMHFSAIAKSIKQSDFKRKDVTTQAIHNELIKDKRFVLIGRGIYALSAWGYSRGTVTDIITEVLKKSDTPLHRDEIVKQVLKSRQVKEEEKS